jgi:predicted metal-binding membrane protein
MKGISENSKIKLPAKMSMVTVFATLTAFVEMKIAVLLCSRGPLHQFYCISQLLKFSNVGSVDVFNT